MHFTALSPFVIGICLTVPSWAQELPELNWEPRSDWINVRTGPSPQSAGDGVADDTAALQTALDRLSANPGEPKTADVRARGEHSLSVRRCTSIGSRLFVEEGTIAPLTVQDCQVSGWTNPSGAIRLGTGPVVLFDCVFTRPPTRHPPITLSGGQHLVLSNRMMEFHGSADDPAGRATIQMAKSHCSQNPVIQFENYRGRVALGPSMFCPGGIKPALITQQGPNQCDFILVACQAYEVTPKFEFSGPGTITLIENTGASMGKNQFPEGAWAQVAAALDDLRKLGALDLALNCAGGKAPGRGN